jgi:hypothetical protein
LFVDNSILQNFEKENCILKNLVFKVQKTLTSVSDKTCRRRCHPPRRRRRLTLILVPQKRIVFLEIKKCISAGGVKMSVRNIQNLNKDGVQTAARNNAVCRDSDMRADAEGAGEMLNYAVCGAIDQMYAEALVKVFNRLLSYVSEYIWISEKGEEAETEDDRPLKPNESIYRVLLQSFLIGAGVEVYADVHNCCGIMDLVALYKGKAVIIEIKLAKDAQAAAEAAAVGMEQMLDKRFGIVYNMPLRLSIAIDASKQRIGCYGHFVPAWSKSNSKVVLETVKD